MGNFVISIVAADGMSSKSYPVAGTHADAEAKADELFKGKAYGDRVFVHKLCPTCREPHSAYIQCDC